MPNETFRISRPNEEWQSGSVNVKNVTVVIRDDNGDDLHEFTSVIESHLEKGIHNYSQVILMKTHLDEMMAILNREPDKDDPTVETESSENKAWYLDLVSPEECGQLAAERIFDAKDRPGRRMDEENRWEAYCRSLSSEDRDKATLACQERFSGLLRREGIVVVEAGKLSPKFHKNAAEAAQELI